MKSAQILEQLKKAAIVPVVRTTDADSAIRAVEAIAEGGIECAEITMTVQGAVKALEQVANRFGDKILLGAGTVLDPETARICMVAGANVFVTPALNVQTIEMCKRYSKPIFPGALTPTEILAAWQAGADGIKVFPCSALGGAKYIKALRGPFPNIEFVPTGGVNLETISDFLQAGCCAVGVGSELIDPKIVKESRWDLLTEKASQYRKKVVEFQATL
jgi:2-dehydro-3-deoxyphosphogluconate aldolase / (4S)-4-hydroxy-2-oxoglutarate aldolase